MNMINHAKSSHEISAVEASIVEHARNLFVIASYSARMWGARGPTEAEVLARVRAAYNRSKDCEHSKQTD